MFTYIKDNQLFLLNPMTGRTYRVGLSLNGEHVVVIPVDTLQYKADVIQVVKDNKAILVRD